VKFLRFINLLLGALLALAPFVLFPVCENFKPDGTRMNCFYSGIFISSMGILIFAFAVLKLKNKIPSLLSILTAACAALCWLVPNEIIRIAGENWACGLCSMPEHACRAETLPAVGVLMILIVIANVIEIIFNFVRGK